MRKKTWKKAMICSLAALMIVSVSGCSSKSGSKNTKETKKEEQAKETKKKDYYHMSRGSCFTCHISNYLLRIWNF